MPNAQELLLAAAKGDHLAAAELLPLVYDELRQLAAGKMACERPNHTLDAAAAELVRLKLCAGCSIDEAAEVLGVSRATACRD